MSRADLRRRIDALNNAINPANSIGAKLAKLTDDQRRAYAQWRDRCATYYASYPGYTAYARFLVGDQPPLLRPDVHTALFGANIQFAANATVAEIQALYHRIAREE